ncbi:MAG TPA: hypothetical protein VF223_15525 [Trebonia sp.]
MLLTSVDGTLVDLRISGYQFPRCAATCKNDWDANWLTVHGEVTQADGKSWTFEDPCLTTWEARALGNWLREAAAGTVPVSPFGTGEPEGRLLFFTEPNLAFSVESRTSDQVRVRVHFSLEALPPWLHGDQRPDIFGYVVHIRLSVAKLADAADSWVRGLAQYPERQVSPEP